jgi:hypothetical protein
VARWIAPAETRLLCRSRMVKDPALKGILYTLRDNDATKSQALYVQEDGKIFKVTKDGTGNFTVVGAQI